TVYTHSRSPHGKTRPLTEPMQALTKRQSLALAVPPFMVDLRGTAENQLAASPRSIDEPLSAICARGQHHGIALPPGAEGAFLVQYYKVMQASSLFEPLPTIPTIDKHGLVQMDGGRIEDWRFRMLDPDKELKP